MDCIVHGVPPQVIRKALTSIGARKSAYGKSAGWMTSFPAAAEIAGKRRSCCLFGKNAQGTLPLCRMPHGQKFCSGVTNRLFIEFGSGVVAGPQHRILIQFYAALFHSRKLKL